MKSWVFIYVSLALASIAEAGPKKKMKRGGISELEANLTALWTKVNRMSSGVQIHLHGMDDAKPHMDDNADGTHVHLHMHMDHDDHRGDGKHSEHKDRNENEYHYGICQVVSNTALPTEDQQPITGNIYFRQMYGEHLEIKVHLEGFEMSGEHTSHLHGLHVHQYGDLSDSCNSLGGHFDPDNNEHGGPNTENRHCGDYGNVECDEEGVARRTFNDDHTSLDGHYSILGRSIVIHAAADDLSSEVDASGGAGSRLACCVVVGSKELDWDTIHGDHEATVVVEGHQHDDLALSHHKHIDSHDYKSNDDTHHMYDHSNDDTNHGYHDAHENHFDHPIDNHEGHVHPDEHDSNHEGHADHVGHAHENHPDHPGHESHKGHVHPDEHDPNHEGHADHVGHAHEKHPDHPGHKEHMGHDHPEEQIHGKGGRKRGKGKKKSRKNKQS